MKTTTFNVTGMTCGGCAASVKRVLLRQEAVKDVEVDYTANRVTATYDEQIINEETIMDAINKLGYQAGLA